MGEAPNYPAIGFGFRMMFEGDMLDVCWVHRSSWMMLAVGFPAGKQWISKVFYYPKFLGFMSFHGIRSTYISP